MRRVIQDALDSLARLSHSALIAISLALTGAVVAVSYATQVELRFSFFYLLPIALTSWFVGRRAGILFAILSAASWVAEFLLEHHPAGSELAVTYWNGTLLLGFFLVLSILLSVLQDALAREKSAARADALTRIPNRRAFFELAEAEIRRASRYGGRFTVAYMDLDNFKQVNDREGHVAGDRVLVLVAEAIRKNIRANDIVARLGGDEFVILLPETGAQDAEAVFRKLDDHLSELMREGHWPVTVSIGALAFEKPPGSVDDMVKLADELMYSVKMSGKNRVALRIMGS